MVIALAAAAGVAGDIVPEDVFELGVGAHEIG
jgi:hypothetical protein